MIDPAPARFRRATLADLPAIVRMLADDPLGAAREDASESGRTAYLGAFHAIEADPNQLLAVAERDGAVIGTLQLSFLPGLSMQGAWRGQIESVRIDRAHRGGGLGRAMLDWAVATCRERGCGLVQLTSNKTRADAIRFYRALGFSDSHVGMKLEL